jgi:hypothetical protein
MTVFASWEGLGAVEDVEGIDDDDDGGNYQPDQHSFCDVHGYDINCDIP